MFDASDTMKVQFDIILSSLGKKNRHLRWPSYIILKGTQSQFCGLIDTSSVDLGQCLLSNNRN